MRQGYHSGVTEPEKKNADRFTGSTLLVQLYWFSGSRASHAAWLAMAAPVGCTRITASSKEQKLRMPVWLTVTGTAVAKYCVAGGPPVPVAVKL
jgi:hypothetical protein